MQVEKQFSNLNVCGLTLSMTRTKFFKREHSIVSEQGRPTLLNFNEMYEVRERGMNNTYNKLFCSRGNIRSAKAITGCGFVAC